MTTSHIFQSTLPHGVRPIVTIEMVKQFSISIHAPAWGATASVGMKAHQIQISIHAPAWGATASALIAGHCTIDFNPRSRMGCDDYAEAIRLGIVNISIHAPRMGSDAPPHRCYRIPRYFNPRSPHGERHPLLPRNRPYEHFNPRSPHGERQQKHEISSLFL